MCHGNSNIKWDITIVIFLLIAYFSWNNYLNQNFSKDI